MIGSIFARFAAKLGPHGAGTDAKLCVISSREPAGKVGGIKSRCLIIALWPFAIASFASAAAAPVTWTDYGCVPNDPAFDNGPVLSRMLDDIVHRRVTVPPIGELADYYIKTTIEWPAWFGGALCGSGGYVYAIGNKNIGCTRILWTGAAGAPMIRYLGCGGRIERLVLSGGPLKHPTYPAVAGAGIEVQARNFPPCGNLVTDQLSITQCDAGLHYLATPDGNHADQQKHFGLMMHHVRVPYWVEGDQSVVHWLYGCDIRSGWETAFKFDKGGALFVYGCYVGSESGNAPKTLLYVGRANDHNGCYEIHGLQVDGGTNNIRLVDHGKYVFRVRIDGKVGKASQLADPFVWARDGETPFADIKLDVRNAVWPEVKK